MDYMSLCLKNKKTKTKQKLKQSKATDKQLSEAKPDKHRSCRPLAAVIPGTKSLLLSLGVGGVSGAVCVSESKVHTVSL